MRKLLHFLQFHPYLLQYCYLKTSRDVDLDFSIEKSKLPSILHCKKISFAKEFINQKELILVIFGVTKPIPLDKLDKFKPSFPYKKNIDRHLLFQQTTFYRSPKTDVNCKQVNCIKPLEYLNYTWLELAKPICVEFVGGETKE